MRIISNTGGVSMGVTNKIQFATHENAMGKAVPSLSTAAANSPELSILRKGYFKAGPINSPLTYIPRISIHQLIRNPDVYVKRKARILERVVKWRTQQTALRLLQSINDVDHTIERSVFSKQFEADMKAVIEKGKISNPTARYYDMASRQVSDFIRLGIKTKEGQTLEFADAHALIQMQQNKDILLTKVVGRDRTRKEYISAGDYRIKVTGKIVSKFADTYPIDEVVKLKEILSYAGTVDCFSPFLSLFDVTGLIVLDYDLQQVSGCRNVQPYSMSCVFEVPDEVLQYEEKVVQDRLKAAIVNQNDWVTIGDILDKFNPKNYLQNIKWL